MEFPCPSCGAELHWNPGQGALTCPHCGTTAEPPAAEDRIVEYPLTQAKLELPMGYGTDTRSLKCTACGAVHDVDPSVSATRCPFCGSSHVDEAGATDLIRPESVLPFAVDRDAAVRKFQDWLGSLWFRPSSLKSGSQIQSISGMYVPVWTFDADASSRWTAEAGYRYQEQEEYEALQDGQAVTKTRTVTKTRWEPASGRHGERYDDWLVQASGGLDQAALKGLLPFELTALKPYDQAYLSGFQAERYGVDLDEAWETAQREIGSAERAACAAEVPGDTHRNLRVETSFDGVTFKHTLLPVWIAAYRYQGQVYRYLVNGQTGKASGEAPYSTWKIVGVAVAFVLALLICMGILSLLGLIGGVAAS